MPKSVLITSSFFSSYNPSTTYYTALSHGPQNLDTTEATPQITYRNPGVLTNLYANSTFNTITGTSTLRVRKNGANGNMVVSVPGTTTGEFKDSVNTDGVSYGDIFNCQIVTGSGGTGLSIRVSTCLFDTNNLNSVTRYSGFTSAGQFSSASSTNYLAIAGDGFNLDGSEVNHTALVRTNLTLQNLYTNIDSNTRTTNTTYRTRIDSTNGNVLVTVGSTQTGIFEDTTNTDSVTSGQKINLSVTTGTGTGTISINKVAIDSLTQNNYFVFLNEPGFNGSASNTYYLPVGGTATPLLSVEARAQGQPQIPLLFSNLCINITTNGATTNGTIQLRINAANGNLVVTIPTGTTGFFEDTSNTDTVTPTQDVNYIIIPGATSPTNWISISLLAKQLTPPGDLTHYYLKQGFQ